MYLKRIEMQGFKSFANKTVLEFKPGITSVIGPNGSGKSNISDAIRWVLGEQSMKQLRGDTSSDIIFAGTQNRKSLGFAEVSIVLDNTDGKLPIEYSEVTVTRSLYRSGESGFYINKTPCRLKDILELFMDTGVGKDGYSIIGQGKIDEILSNKSEDRRKVFEEAAGIVKYKTRKFESEKKLEQTKVNLLRINDILTEIETNLEPLKEQADRATKYLEYRNELKNIEVGLFVYEIENIRNKISQIRVDYEILENQYSDENVNLQDCIKVKNEIKEKIDNITNRIEEIQSLSNNSSTKIEQINSSISVNKERISNNKENSDRLLNEIEELNQKIVDLNNEKNDRLNKKNSLDENKKKFETELKEREAELEEIKNKLGEEELSIEDKKKELDDLINKQFNTNVDIKSVDVHFENLEKRKKQISNDLTSTISELDSMRISKEELSSEFNKINKLRSETLTKLEEAKNKKSSIDEKIEEFDKKINKLEDEVRNKITRRNFLIETENDKEGYYKSVKSILLEAEKNASFKNGTHGALADLISTDKKYQVAIELALGSSLQNIVTDNESIAKKLIEYLRNGNLGRATFMPLTAIKGSKLTGIKTGNGVLGLACDLVKYDKKYEQIVLNLLGKTVVVEDLNDAISLSKANKYSFRIVTLKGDIINPSGMMQGGSVNSKSSNIFGRKNEINSLEKEINTLHKDIDDLTKEKNGYIKSVENVLKESEEYEEKIHEIDVDFALQKEKITTLSDNIKKLETKRDSVKSDDKKIGNQIKDNRNSKDKLVSENEELQKSIENLTSFIDEYTKKNKDTQEKINELNDDITNLKISVNSFDESKFSIEEIITRIDNDVKKAIEDIENKKNAIESLKGENANLEKSIEELIIEIEKIKSLVNNSSTEIKNLKNTRELENKKLDEQDKKIADNYKLIENLKEQIVKLDSKKMKLEQDSQDKINELWDEYEITPNNASEYEKPSNISVANKKVNELKDKIKSLGLVNVNSIEEYKKTKSRYEFMNEQRADLEETQAKLRKVIQELIDKMKSKFSKNFKLINKYFNDTFVELFGGGRAELILEDPNNILECGIEIKAQPEGKKLQNMSLLSGGEKTFTAIALLFAILKLNPSPFCILDEIEAALDDVNVNRFAQYLKKYSDNSQFLIITHRKGTMEVADSVYGITMEENGISKLLSMKLNG